VNSSVLDNIAGALIGGAMAHQLFRAKVHIGYLAAIVAACLVLAGPGVGKTTVLTTRIARILDTSQNRNFRILALTFTTKSGDEMRTRVEELGVRRCPAIGRQLTGCKGVFDPAKPLLVHLDEETRKPPFADHYRAEKTLHFLRSQSAEPIYVRLT